MVLIDCRDIPTTCRGHPEEDCGNQTLSIPSALWFPGAGLGASLTDEYQKRFLARLGRYCCERNTTVVFFCYGKTSWLSINAALRAASDGYLNIDWYRDLLVPRRSRCLARSQTAADSGNVYRHAAAPRPTAIGVLRRGTGLRDRSRGRDNSDAKPRSADPDRGAGGANDFDPPIMGHAASRRSTGADRCVGRQPDDDLAGCLLVARNRAWDQPQRRRQAAAVITDRQTHLQRP